MNMREKRKRLLDEAKKMAEMAGARPGGEFTADELVRIDAIKAEVDELTDKIRKVDEAQEIIRKMAGEPPVFGRAEGVKLDPLADAFTEAYGPDGTKSALSPAGATMVPVSIGAVIEARTQPTLGGLITQKELPGSDRFTYLRQTVRTNNAAHVPIGDEKPTSVYTLDRVSGQAVTVAHLSEPIPRQWLADVTGLQTFITSEMSHGLTLAVDSLVLNGSADPDEPVDGLLSTTGVRQQAFLGDVLATTRRALTTLEQAEEAPTAFVFSPLDWETIETLRDQADRFLVAGQPQQRAARVLHGVPVIVSPRLPVGMGLLGDWRAIELLVREGIRIDWSEAGGDLFDKNLLKFRAECRVGVAIKRPGALSVIELSSGGSS